MVFTTRPPKPSKIGWSSERWRTSASSISFRDERDWRSVYPFTSDRRSVRLRVRMGVVAGAPFRIPDGRTARHVARGGSIAARPPTILEDTSTGVVTGDSGATGS